MVHKRRYSRQQCFEGYIAEVGHALWQWTRQLPRVLRQQHGSSCGNLASLYRCCEECMRRQARRACREHDGCIAGGKEGLHFLCQRLTVAVVVQRESSQLDLWPVGLSLSKPIWKQAQREVSLVNPLLVHALNRRKCQVGANA